MPDPLQWIDSQHDHMLSLLEKWSAINSYSYHLPGVSRMADALTEEMSKLGEPVERIPLPPARSIDTAGNFHHQDLGPALRLIRRPNAPTRVLLNIHYDTVYPPDSPFQSPQRLDQTTLCGPGVLDAKGGIIVLLTAAAAIERSDVAHRIGYEVLLTPDEEIGSPGSGDLLVEAAKRNGLALLFEPAMPDGALVDSRKGSGNFSLIVRGKAAHAGRDFHAGRNAITACADLALQIESCCRDTPDITINVGKIDGGGPLNVVPDLAIARFNVRVKTAEQQRILEQRLHSILSTFHRDGITTQLHGGLHAPPKELDPQTQKLLDLILDCGPQLNLNLPHRLSGGASDGNRIAAAGIPVIDSMGPIGADLHSDREHVLIHSLTERAKLTALVLMKLAERPSS